MTVSTIEEWRNSDTMLDFHAGWHTNFPWNRRWDEPRQGEEFVYFHRQFLAWYTAERIARGLSMVLDWKSDDPIPEAHTNQNGTNRPQNWSIPGPLQSSFEIPSWFTRAGHPTNSYTDNQSVNVPSTNFRKLSDFPNVDVLGKALEHPLHNMGHGAMGGMFRIGDVRGDMATVGNAPRDPFFFMWHRLIDNIWREWSELPDVTLPQPNPLPVTIRNGNESNATNSPDIIIRRTRVGDPASELGDFDNLDIESDSVHYGQTAYLYARLENNSNQDVSGTVHFFYAPMSLAMNRRYWVEIPSNNAGRWGTRIHLGSNEKQVIRSGPMPGTIVWNSQFVPAPNNYRLLVMMLPDNAPLGYPFERALPPNSTVENLVLDNTWMAWRDFIVEDPSTTNNNSDSSSNVDVQAILDRVLELYNQGVLTRDQVIQILQMLADRGLITL